MLTIDNNYNYDLLNLVIKKGRNIITINKDTKYLIPITKHKNKCNFCATV